MNKGKGSKAQGTMGKVMPRTGGAWEVYELPRTGGLAINKKDPWAAQPLHTGPRPD